MGVVAPPAGLLLPTVLLLQQVGRRRCHWA
jgi:hypothetical protein